MTQEQWFLLVRFMYEVLYKINSDNPDLVRAICKEGLSPPDAKKAAPQRVKDYEQKRKTYPCSNCGGTGICSW